ncbi:MAG: M1 family aminopeptidase [Cyclobacteriaceae bacterium]
MEHVLVNFGGQALARYSEMNGYGHFLTGYLWVKAYWILLGLLLLFLASVLKVNGKETGLKKRWSRGFGQMTKPMATFGLIAAGLFFATGSYIFYNTNVLNEFWTDTEKDTFRAGYEKALKQMEYTPQPKIVGVQLKIDLFPSERAYEITGNYVITNSSPLPIREIHIQKVMESNITLADVEFDRKAELDNTFAKYDYTIYELSPSMAPGDTMNMRFTQTLRPEGFEANNSGTDVVYNGTFFDNAALPSFGYQRKIELQDADARSAFGLAPRVNKADRDDKDELRNARTGSDSDGIMLDVVISTESPQTAVTSGDLITSWTRENRNYFHYKTDQRIINFYPIVSANYEVLRDNCIPAGNPSKDVVDLEIYYQKGHEYNLDRMMESMKMSLDYYSTNFSPYQYKQVRIVEFPRYRSFAQSLPTIIPFSEASGFVMNIDNDTDVDMPFYITAHEMAHQWWGLQLEAANVKGQSMILETLAQYSAIMILKEKYPEAKVQQFLKPQLDDYMEGNLKSKKEEPPLALVENESHVYYNKGALNMYELQERIGEDNVNLALRHFLADWRSFDNAEKPDRYSTTRDLIQYFQKVTPDSMQHLITDLFEEVNSVEVFG